MDDQGMAGPSKLGQYVERLLSAPGDQLSRWAKFLRFQIQLWRLCVRLLRFNNATAMAAALSFRTIFALVPALVLVVVISNAVHVTEGDQRWLRRTLDAAGFTRVLVREETPPSADEAPPEETSQEDTVAPIGRTATDVIIDVVEGVQKKLTLGRIGPLGVLLLIWTTLTLLTTIELSLNRVFEAPRSRPFLRRVLMYWAAVTLVPIILLVANYLAGYLREEAAGALDHLPMLGPLVAFIGWVGNFVVGVVVLGVVYTFMPNTRVRFRAAASGAVITLALWLLAKYGFEVYRHAFVRTGNLNIYGALGLLPLFLFWLYVSWLIFLFGAQIAHTGANLRRLESAELAQKITVGPADMLSGALAVAAPHAAGEGPVAFERIERQLGLPDAIVQKIMDGLVALGIVCAVESDAGGAYVMAKPLDKIPVLEVMEFLPDTDERSHEDVGDRQLRRTVAHIKERVGEATGSYTLSDVLAQEGK